MVVKVISSAEAISEAVKLARPAVIPVYPITPQTKISEKLADYVADGELDSQYIRVESEHSAMSAAIGASGAGVRVFTATSSQGLAYMHEPVFAAAGMRLPIVMANANRALSAPINIWNDQQDSISERDSGWIQLFCETGQEAFDTVIQAYKIAENPNICVPVMVCVDGFILTHTVDPVELISQEEANEFLPPFEAVNAYLRTEDPMSLGTLADPDHYLEIRYELEQAINDSKALIEEVGKEYGDKFGRYYGLIEEYKSDDAEIILISMGSICGTIKEVIDEQREAGKKIGLIRVRSYRPFPKEALKEAVKDAKLAVIDKDISFSVGGALFTDVKSSVSNETYGYVMGLGGRDITPSDIEEVITKTENPTKEVEWIGLRE